MPPILVGALVLVAIFVVFQVLSDNLETVLDAAWGVWTILSWVIGIVSMLFIAHLIGSIFV